MELLSVRRSGGNWRSTGMCADLHCTTTALHTHTMSCTVHTTALLSHSTLVAAFHQNFTPILTITQLVTVRSNHSESENHDRLLLIKLLESVADCERAESKVWVIRPNQLFRNLSDDFHRSKFPMAIVWDAAGSKNWWEFSGKAQRPTLRSSCLQSQLWQFVRIMRRFLRLNIMSTEQPWEPLANCDLLQCYDRDGNQCKIFKILWAFQF